VVSYKKIMVRLLLVVEMVLFFGNFLYSKNGLMAIVALKHENMQLSQEISEIKDSLFMMEEQLVQWNRYPFYKEKVAREQLHMIRPDEIIYFNL